MNSAFPAHQSHASARLLLTHPTKIFANGLNESKGKVSVRVVRTNEGALDLVARDKPLACPLRLA